MATSCTRFCAAPESDMQSAIPVKNSGAELIPPAWRASNAAEGLSAGQRQPSFARLQKDLAEQISEQHEVLRSELRSLRTEMLSAINSTYDPHKLQGIYGHSCVPNGVQESRVDAKKVLIGTFAQEEYVGKNVPIPRTFPSQGQNGNSPQRLSPIAGLATDMSQCRQCVDLPEPGLSREPHKVEEIDEERAKKVSELQEISDDVKAAEGDVRAQLKRNCTKALQKEKDIVHDAYKRSKGWHPETPMKGSTLDILALERDTDTSALDRLPPWRQNLRKLVEGTKFNLFWGFLIVLNAAVMGAQLEYQGYLISVNLGLRETSDSEWPDAEAAFKFFEVFFTVLFLIELCIRLVAHGYRFLMELANWLDVIVVASSIFSALGVSIGVNLTFARLVRIAKLVRILRVVRTMNLFRELRVLVKTIAASIGALAWSMVLLGVIEMIAALFLSQALGETMLDETVAFDTRKFVFVYYGTASRALLTMFEITLAPGAWAKVGRPLIEEVNSAFAFFFVAYVAGVTFAIIRVITAVFLRETLQVASSDNELMIAEKMLQKSKYRDNVQDLFVAADKNHSGGVSLEEFEEILREPRVKSWLSVLELEVHEVCGLYHLLDNGDGCITFDEFLTGIVRLKGSAKSVDVVTLLYENQKLNKRLMQVQELLESCSAMIQSKFSTFNC